MRLAKTNTFVKMAAVAASNAEQPENLITKNMNSTRLRVNPTLGNNSERLVVIMIITISLRSKIT
jgi:hypothetical protein